jgi:hypothetical protein
LVKLKSRPQFIKVDYVIFDSAKKVPKKVNSDPNNFKLRLPGNWPSIIWEMTL